MTLESILPIPDIFSARRVLCIQPHYDDNDIGAGGTLAKLARQGAELFYLTVTDDLLGVTDVTLSDEAAAILLKDDQERAGQIIGVSEQILLKYPDSGEYNTVDLRRDFLKIIRHIQPDLIFAPDAWLTYEGHPDHIRTGLAAAEAVIYADLLKVASSDPAVDAAYRGHPLMGIAFYYTREPNQVVDISETWLDKLAAVQCYQAQFTTEGMQELVMALMAKTQQVCAGMGFEYGEPLKIFHPRALHCGI